MALQIDHNNPKNILFLEFIIQKIKDKEGLELSNVIDIEIQKGITPFPIFEKTKPNENINIAIIEEKMNANKDYDQEAESIGKYLYEIFKESVTMRAPLRTKENPLTFNIVLVITNSYEIWKISEELKRVKLDMHTTEKEMTKSKSTSLPIIEYHCESGLGYMNGKKFKLKNNQPDYFVFMELYKNIGKTVKYSRILELSGFTNTENDSWKMIDKKKAEKSLFNHGSKYFLNKLVGKIRKLTGLSNIYLIINNGDMILRAIKAKKETK